MVDKYRVDDSTLLLVDPSLLDRPSNEVVATIAELTTRPNSGLRDDVRNVRYRVQGLLAFHIPNHRSGQFYVRPHDVAFAQQLIDISYWQFKLRGVWIAPESFKFAPSGCSRGHRAFKLRHDSSSIGRRHSVISRDDTAISPAKDRQRSLLAFHSLDRLETFPPLRGERGSPGPSATLETLPTFHLRAIPALGGTPHLMTCSRTCVRASMEN
jgi:hypothetical protein